MRAASGFFALCVAVPLSQSENDRDRAPEQKIQSWGREAMERISRGEKALKTRVSRQERIGSLTDDQRDYMSKQILQAISEMMNKEGCFGDHPLSDREYQGWMDFGRRSAEEGLD
ncbi:hypothetical protein AAFF_G00260990 [Aldrovandia affinis]|uniref:Gastrin/cholecystokinin peptide hormone domain-containing protein n=1 Tax=Aldrovandia affinis TaxID=143900 RepID=A0AAD7RCF6_9TELE|nr:hypothetical protein AAFF_G00260990 [Aldrovandia affinis]